MKINLLLTLLFSIYAIPISRLALFFIPAIDSCSLRKINSLIGRLEWLIRPWRDSIVLLGLLFLTARGIYDGILFPTVYYGVSTAVSIFSILRFKFFVRKMAEFAKNNRFVHPKEFFECYYSGFGIFPTKLPKEAKNIINPLNCSFKKGRSSKRLWPSVAGVFNTASLGKIITSAFNWRGAEYARRVAQNIFIIWGARSAYLGNLSVKTEGIERLGNLKGKFIFAFNHKSYLDFALGTFAIPGMFNFRYLAARDHFLDNRFLYFIMGRAMQVIGTIFVDRKNKESSPKSAAISAAEKLANFDLDIVMFPQGTRAYGNINAEGARLDSGYYTSGTKERLKETGGHIKKGAAHIAVDTAILLKKIEQSIVHIIPVGLVGTGLAAPRKSLTVQTNTEITVKIGQPITIKGTDVGLIERNTFEYKTFVDDIHKHIDDSLKNLLEIHSLLEKRFFKDIRSLLPAADYEHVAVAMKAWRGKDYLIYTILDCIYAAHPKNWPSLLREISNLLISDAPVGTLLHFRERAVDIMVEGTKP